MSVLLGIGAASFFAFKFKKDICPILPDILSEPLIVWLGYKDVNGCLSQEQKKRLKEITSLKSR